MDLIDTIMQKFGLKQASVELALTRMLDEIAPGLGRTLMYGLFDQLTGATGSSRVGLGDILPLTGAFREGADVAREAQDALGPAFGAALQWGEWGVLSADYAAQTVGLKDKTIGFSDWARQSPVSAVRTITDTALYMSDGEITNTRGQLVSPDVTAATVAIRALGFYPTEATLANNIVRLGRIEDNYIKAVKAQRLNAYVNAKRHGDNERASIIAEDVARWNVNAKDAGLDQYVIKNFQRDALRSMQAANKSATERFAGTGERNKDLVDEMTEAYGL